VAFSLDLRDGAPLTSAEALRTMSPRELARRAVDAGVETVIVLDLARVGRSGGTDEAMLHDLRAALPGVDLIAGGGVRDQADLDRLAAAGADGALVATALHRGVIGRGRA
jgi:phosphoribosylformimino-5-aminoimidazole carboxamide ribotide isomerase